MASPETPDTVTAHLIGPIHGVSNFRAKFLAAQKKLEKAGKRVTTPMDAAPVGATTEESGGGVPPHTPVWQSALRACLKVLLCVDEVWVLPGWENSSGTCAEIYVAQTVGIPVYSLETGVLLVKLFELHWAPFEQPV